MKYFLRHKGQNDDFFPHSDKQSSQKVCPHDILIGLSNISVQSYSSSQETIAVVSEFIRKVDSYRAEMGAVQNRLEATISNQENVIENVSDARSRIRDVDYAVETANMTQQSIIQQASTTILTQANQKTQIAMNLLQG